ncbi:MAG TPA: sugar ABC transporter substrate-binding protein [Pseudolabrys sp.]|nr:sugar ABC transporter substrate-binding protein [Pseudolabrys sp.]
MKKAILLISILSVAGFTAGPVLADGETVAVFTKNQTNPFFESIRVGAAKAAASVGVKVIQYVPIKPDSIPEQLSQVEDAIVKKPNALLFTPVDYKALVPAIEKVNAAGIPVTGLTDKLAGGQVVSFIGAEDYRLGLETGQSLLKAMGGKGNVVALEGVKGAISNTDRMKGLTDALKEFPNVKLVATQPANYQRLQALQVMENIMQTHAQIDGVFAANDAMATGVVEAMSAANRKAFIVGINGSQEAIDLIKGGKMHATGSSDPFMQGCLGMLTTVRALRKMPVKKELMVTPVIIDSVNYKQYDVPVATRSCPKIDDVATN